MNQNFEIKNQKIHAAFNELKLKYPDRLKKTTQSFLEQLGIWHRIVGRFLSTSATGGNPIHRTPW